MHVRSRHKHRLGSGSHHPTIIVEFTTDELREALREFAAARGVVLPKGRDRAVQPNYVTLNGAVLLTTHDDDGWCKGQLKYESV